MRQYSRALAALLFTSALSAPAFADPAYRNLDGNGVDLVLDDLMVTFPEGSVGSGDAELVLNRIISGGKLSSNWDSYTFKLERVGTSSSKVTIGKPNRTSDTFTISILGDASVENPDGTSLSRDHTTGTYVYRTADGTAVTFVNPDYDVVPPPPDGLCAPTSPQTGCTLLPESVTSPNGSVVYLSFDSPVNGNARKLLGVRNNFGYSISFTYSGYDRTRADFSRGSTVVGSALYSYPAVGGIDVTDMAGHVWHITTTSITRPGESSPYFSVGGSSSAVTSVTNEGVTTTYARTVSGSTGTMVVTNPTGDHTTIVSNLTIGRPTSVTDALSHTTTYTYDTYGRLTDITQPEGNRVHYVLNSRGSATSTQVYPKSGTGYITTSAVYPSTCTNPVSCNQPISTTDADFNTTNYAYDPTSGLLTAVTFPAPATGAVRPETRYSYTQVGGVYELTGVSQCQTGSACTGAADEVKATAAYDSYGNVTSVTQAAGDGTLSATTTYTYNALGDRLTADGPLPGSDDTTTWRYDAARRQVGAIAADPDGAGARQRAAVRTTYDAAGRVTSVENGTVSGTTDTSWSAFASASQITTTWVNGRKARDSVTAGGTNYQVTDYSYDSDGRLECAAVRMDPAQFAADVNLGACFAGPNTAPYDRISQLHYDAAGRQDKMLVGYHTPDEAYAWQKSFSANGQVSEVLDGKGNRTTYAYDAFDRLQKTSYPDPTVPGASSTTDYEELVYDNTSNVTSRRLRGYASDSAQHIDYTYDHLNRLIAKNLPGSEPDVTYTYDNLSRPTGASQTGNDLTFSYDALSRMINQTGPRGTMSSTWDVAGRRTGLQWRDGFHVSYDYNVLDQMMQVRDSTDAPGNVLATYSYDDLGNRTGATFGNGTSSSWTPDPLSRLQSLAHTLAGTASVTRSFTYNPASQIVTGASNNDSYAWTSAVSVSNSYTANGLNQYTDTGGTTLKYDDRGNLTDDGPNSYTYSSENLLKTVSTGAVLGYDPLLRLFSVTQGAATTQFAYDGLERASEYDGSGTLLRRYVFGPGTDEPIVWYEGSGTTDRRWLHADERGSIIAVTNGSGAALTVNRYDEYGVPQNDPITHANTNIGRFQYTGQAWLPEVGLYYYKARMYSPNLGRFMQTDPIGYADGMNWYNYVGGDPVNFVDPSGTRFSWVERRACVTTGHGVEDCTSFPRLTWVDDETTVGEFVRGWIGVATGRGDCSTNIADKSAARCSVPQNKQCYGPPAAPGTGSTQSELAAQARNNAAQAASHYWNPLNIFWFRSQVQNKGPWDYKQYDRGYQDFGNYNYGRTGAAMGLATDFLLGQAGRAQQAAGTSKPEWGNPGFLGYGGLGGTGSYGDDPRDQEMIRRGISDQRNGC